MNRYEDPADGLLAGPPDASLDSRHPKEEESMKAPRKGKLRAVPDTPDIAPPVEDQTWQAVSGEPVVWMGGFASGHETPKGTVLDYGGKTRAQEANDSMMILAVVLVVSVLNLALIALGVAVLVWWT